MSSRTLAFYYKRIIAEMPASINTIAELNVYHKEAVKKAKIAEAVDAMKRIRAKEYEKAKVKPVELEMDYNQMCYAFQLKDENMWGEEGNNWVDKLYDDCFDKNKVFKVEIVFLKTYKGRTIDPAEEIAYKMSHYYTIGHDGIPDNAKVKHKNHMKGEKDTFKRNSDYNDFIANMMRGGMSPMMDDVYGYYDEEEDY